MEKGKKPSLIDGDDKEHNPKDPLRCRRNEKRKFVTCGDLEVEVSDEQEKHGLGEQMGGLSEVF